ncbi:MAG: DNA polymerase III subunit delta, partial [Bacteroidia bacterium]|nr:DNA polymerase III subunit delta [Bacteroidia bacterium]
DIARSIRIVQYFEANPKAAPIQLVLPSLYNFFSKVFMVFGANTTDEKSLSATIGVNPFFIKEYLKAAKLYKYEGVEKALLLMHNYNLKSVGVRNIGTEDASLLKEMIVKIVD